MSICTMVTQLLFFGTFLLWTILEVYTEFVTILLLFYVLVFWPGVRDLCSPIRDGTCILALEGEVLTNGPQESSPLVLCLCAAILSINP